MRKHRQNWLDVFQGFRISLDARKIVLGTFGVYVTVLAFIALLFVASFWWPGTREHIYNLLQQPLKALPEFFRAVAGKFVPSLAVPGTAGGGAGFREIAFVAGTGIVMLFIWAFFGGAIARIAAVDFARGERPDINEATAFAAKKFGSFFWAPIVPFIFVIIFLLCNALLGLIGRIPGIGPIIVGIFFFLAVLSAFLVLILSIGGVFGFIYMWPTIAMEGTDAFDAISRGFNYLFARPWKTVWCVFMTCVYGCAVIAFVAGFTWLMLKIALASVAFGLGAERFEPIRLFLVDWYFAKSAGIPMLICMILIRVLLIIAWGLVLGYVVSYKITAWTLIYGVMRREVDGTDMSEVYLPEEEPRSAAGEEAASKQEQSGN